MKKSLLSSIVIIALLYTSRLAFAQEERVSNLGDVTLRFCNDTSIVGGTKSLIMDTETEKDGDICIYVNNNGPTDVKISLNFVDGTVTADEDQKKACEPEDLKHNFGQYVSVQDTALFIQAGQTLQTHAKIRFPAGYAGTSYGCVTYQILQDSMTGAESNVGMFSIVSRRANFIDAHVKGEIIQQLVVLPETNSSLEPINKDTNITLYKNLVDNIYRAKVTLLNTGNVGVEADIKWKVQLSKFIYSSSFGTSSQKILPNQSKSFEYNIPLWLQYVGGLLEVSFDVQYRSILARATEGNKDTTIKTLDLDTTHLFFPRWIFLVSALIGRLIRWKKYNTSSDNNKMGSKRKKTVSKK